MRHAALKVLMALTLAVLAGCGFQLRGQVPLPFESAYVDAPPGSALGAMLAKQLAQQAKLANQRDKAEVIIKIAGEGQNKSILTLSSSGKVQEYRLTSTATVSAIDPKGDVVLPPSSLQQVRDYSYNDQYVLASDTQEATLRSEMTQDMLQQILRRLAFVRKQ